MPEIAASIPPPTVPASAVGLLLAAGKGTRLRSRLPKAAHLLAGKPLGRYGIDLLHAVGIPRVCVVIGHQAEAVRAALGDDVEYVLQEVQGGTGHAVLSTQATLQGVSGPVVVVQADNVLLQPADVARLLERHAATGAAVTFLTALVTAPGAYGRIIHHPDGSFAEIMEARACTPEQLAIREINVGAYVFDPARMFDALRRVRPNEQTGESYLGDAFPLLLAEGHRIEAVLSDDSESALGINDRVELAATAALIRRRILNRLMLEGVTIEDPAATYVDATVRIGSDTTLRPQTFLTGNTVIGEGCTIGPCVEIADCVIGNQVQIRMAVLAESQVADGTKIGPFAQLRAGCRVGRKVKIGNFVELKNTTVDDRASMGHFAYLGDADIGEHTNIGAGTITCNYDGRRKHRTRIGREAFIGTNSTLVAPVAVGDGAYVAAATVVTEDVPEDALAIGRSRQSVKLEWARRRRERQAAE